MSHSQISAEISRQLDARIEQLKLSILSQLRAEVSNFVRAEMSRNDQSRQLVAGRPSQELVVAVSGEVAANVMRQVNNELNKTVIPAIEQLTAAVAYNMEDGDSIINDYRSAVSAANGGASMRSNPGTTVSPQMRLTGGRGNGQTRGRITNNLSLCFDEED